MNVLHSDVKGLKFLLNVTVVVNLMVMMSIYFFRDLDRISSRVDRLRGHTCPYLCPQTGLN